MQAFGVVIAAVAAFMLGAMWYSFLFVKPWKKAIGFVEGQESNGPSFILIMCITLVVEVFVAYILSMIMITFKITTFGDTFVFGVLVGSIVSLSSLKNYLYESKKISLFFISEGYKFVITLLMVLILQIFI